MAAPELQSSFRYLAGGSQEVSVFAQQLAERRNKDLARGAITYGPSRDDLELLIDGRSAKSFASQGQQRLLTLALKIAELKCVRDVTEMEPMLLLDDVSSELDSERTAAVFRFLSHCRSQIFVTTTRPDLFEKVQSESGVRADFRLHQGSLVPTAPNDKTSC
jgi:DNA replication and repair protein RecF